MDKLLSDQHLLPTSLQHLLLSRLWDRSLVIVEHPDGTPELRMSPQLGGTE